MIEGILMERMMVVEAGGGVMPGRTPLRDQLGLNDPDAAIAAESRRAEKVLICCLPKPVPLPLSCFQLPLMWLGCLL